MESSVPRMWHGGLWVILAWCLVVCEEPKSWVMFVDDYRVVSPWMWHVGLWVTWCLGLVSCISTSLAFPDLPHSSFLYSVSEAQLGQAISTDQLIYYVVRPLHCCALLCGSMWYMPLWLPSLKKVKTRKDWDSLQISHHLDAIWPIRDSSLPIFYWPLLFMFIQWVCDPRSVPIFIFVNNGCRIRRWFFYLSLKIRMFHSIIHWVDFFFSLNYWSKCQELLWALNTYASIHTFSYS